MRKAVALVAALLGVAACHPQGRSARPSDRAAEGPPSHAHPEKVRVTHMALDLTIDASGHAVDGRVVLDVERADPRAPLVLDSEALAIREVRGADGKPRRFTLGKETAGQGAALTVELAPEDRQVAVSYAPRAGADKLVRTSRSILGRAFVPMQDAPAVHASFSATVHAPAGTTLALSAEPLGPVTESAARVAPVCTTSDAVVPAAHAVSCSAYAAPGATAGGSGAITSPFTLEQALAAGSVPAGSTICLRGGTYGAGGKVVFESRVADVVVTSAPGEHAVIDGGLHITGNHVTLRQVEVKNSQPGPRPPAIDVDATGVTLVLNLVHDGGDAGILLRPASREVTLEGNLVYGSERGVRGSAHQLTLRGNAIARNVQQQVDLTDGSDATLEGNAVLGALRTGLDVRARGNLMDDAVQLRQIATASGTLAATSAQLGANGALYLRVGGPAVGTPQLVACDAAAKTTAPAGGPAMRVERLEDGAALVSVAARQGETAVELDPEGLGLGHDYEVWNAANPCGDRPLLGHTPSGSPIHIPLTGWTGDGAGHAFLVTSGRAGDLCGACDHYAGPSVAAGSGSGRLDDPWNLQDVLTRPSLGIQPGRTVCLLEGEYVPQGKEPKYEVSLSGAKGAPVHIRPFPGQHVSINGGFEVHGSHLTFRDLEVYNSGFQRVTAAYKDPAPKNSVNGFALMRANGKGAPVTDVKVIDCRVHDTRIGNYTQTATTDAEFTGNLVYNNGWDEPDAPGSRGRGHGHGFYLQSHDGLQWAMDNLVFNNFGAGVEMFGNGALSGYRVLRNSIYEKTTAMSLLAHKKAGSYFRVDDVTVEDNLGFGGTYAFGSEDGVFGQHDGGDFGTLRLIGNTFVDACYRLQILGWRHPVVIDNTVQVQPSAAAVIGWKWSNPGQNGTFSKVSGTSFDASAWSHNRWYKASPDPEFARVNGSASLEWSPWVALGFDAAARPHDSSFNHAPLTGQQVVNHPDVYAPLRGSVTVFNHDGARSFDVDLGAFGFTPGRRYVIRNAFDPCNASGKNVVTGTYNGAPVALSLDPADYTLALPLCYDPAKGHHAAEIQPLPLPRFGLFLVQPDEPGYCAATQATCTL